MWYTAWHKGVCKCLHATRVTDDASVAFIASSSAPNYLLDFKILQLKIKSSFLVATVNKLLQDFNHKPSKKIPESFKL